jgi:ATP-dependent helicase/nuclease subunit A
MTALVLPEPMVAAIDSALVALGGVIETTNKTRDYKDLLKTCKANLLRRRLRWGDWAKLTAEEPAKKSLGLVAGVKVAANAHCRHPRMRREMHSLIDALFESAALGLTVYQRRKDDLGLMDYVDQEVRALELLKRDDVRAALEGKIDLVLVDEFQDTSPLQLAIFLQLARLAKQSVWVGDPKQAIYGFRGTDPALMDAAIESLSNPKDPDLMAAAVQEVVKAGQVETLSRSYRSRPALIAVTNEIFAAAFAKHGMPEERTRVQSELVKDPPELGLPIAHWTLAGKNQFLNAQALAAGIAGLLASKPQVRDRQTGVPRDATGADVGILCRTNAQCQNVAEALGQQGLAAVVARVGLLNTAEGQVLLAGLQLWIDPRDSLAAALLHRIIECPDDPERFARDVLAESAAACLSGGREVTAIVSAREQHRDASVLAAIDLVIDATGLRRLCAEWGASAQRIANLDAFRAHASEYCDERAAALDTPSLVGLLGYMNDLLGGWGWDEKPTDRCATVAGQEAITVSTWHAAKGLEWPIVTLYGLETLREPMVYGVHVMSDKATFDIADPLDGRWIRFWPNPYTTSNQGGLVKVAYGQSEAHAAVLRKSEREALRVLYVGWTRARDRLILAAQEGKLLGGLLGVLSKIDPALISTLVATSGVSSEVVPTTWAGHRIDVEVRACAAQDPTPMLASAGSMRFGRTAGAYPAARLQPSAAEARSFSLRETVKLGDPLRAWGNPDVKVLGTAIHGFLAADSRELAPADREALAVELLGRYDLLQALPSAMLLEISERLWGWLAERFPGSRIRREWPIAQRLEGGTMMSGTVDLLVETAEQMVIVDHKSTATYQGAVDKAGVFAAQLACYADAAGVLRPGMAISTWVHLPMAGYMVEVVL